MTRDDIIRMAREAGLEVFVFDGVEEIGVGDGYHIQTDLIERFAALVAALQQEPETCVWQQDGDSDSGVYGTSCRHYFNLEDGTPEDNKMRWCCYCGKKLAQELITESEDE